MVESVTTSQAFEGGDLTSLDGSRSSWRRIAAISGSLVGTQAATSVLGLLFWGLAARRFSVEAVGVAGAAISLMTLLGTLGTLGLGTLLIARLPHTDLASRRLLVRSALAVAGAAAAVLAIVMPWTAAHVFGAQDLSSVAGSPVRLGLFSVGTGLMAVALVLDQAVLVIGSGSVQLERNVVASATKLLALGVLSVLGQHDGLAVFAAWALGTLVSLPVVAWRTRLDLPVHPVRELVNLSSLRGLGRAAVGHHALNTTLMAALMVLPLIVTVAVSPGANGVFTTALQVSGFVFALPYAISIGLFAAAEGDEREVLDRMRLTVPLALGISVVADLVLYPLAPVVLSIFGSTYADQGADVLRVLVLAGLPFVIKDHFVALRRVQGRTLAATSVLAGFTVIEVAAALLGARVGGALGLSACWVAVLFLEAGVLSVALFRGVRAPAAAGRREPVVDLPEGPFPGVMGGYVEPLVEPDNSPVRGVEDDGVHVGRTRRPPQGGVGPLMLLMALGLLAIAWSVSLARRGQHNETAQLFFVAGLVAIFFPAAFGVMLPGLGRAQRILLAVSMPLFLQLSRVMLYPTRFMFHDEMLHANALRLIEATGRLFTENPLLPITSYYPGLEIATDAVTDLSGLSPHTSAVLVLLATRTVMALAIIAVVERLTGSVRIAAVSAVIYSCNPQLLFFNSQFSYQTIALPLALLCVYLFVSRPRGRAWSLVLPLLTMVAVTLSHHVTAGLLVLALLVWLLVEVVLRRDREHEIVSLAAMAVSGTGLLALSVLNPGNTLGSYLGAIVTSSESALTQFAHGGQDKQLFQNSAGVGTARWEQVLVISSLAITVLVLVPALFRSRRWVRARVSAAVLLGLVALIYPIIPAGHLTRSTAEVGDRAAGFVFLGVGFVVACWVCQRRARFWHAPVFAVAATVTFLGGVVLGAGPVIEQLPGPYQVSADARSIDPANLAAAAWIARNLPSGSRVYADRVGGLLAAADGGQFTVRHISTGIDASRLLLDPHFGPEDVRLIRQAGIRYLIVDRRDAFGLPNQGVYVESGEFGELGRTAPVPAAALDKFDEVPGVDRIYDNGSIAIYDVGVFDADR